VISWHRLGLTERFILAVSASTSTRWAGAQLGLGWGPAAQRDLALGRPASATTYGDRDGDDQKASTGEPIRGIKDIDIKGWIRPRLIRDRPHLRGGDEDYAGWRQRGRRADRPPVPVQCRRW
jgi:hypothetical protein